MNFLKEGKTNWKYILIVVILAIIVGGGILWWVKKPEVPPTELPKIEKPEEPETMIRNLIQKFYEALEDQDGELLMSYFTPPETPEEKESYEWLTGADLVKEELAKELVYRVFMGVRISNLQIDEIKEIEKEKFLVTGRDEIHISKAPAYPEEIETISRKVSFIVVEIEDKWLVDKYKWEHPTEIFRTEKYSGFGHEEIIADLSNWKTYRNEEYGYEVKYPGDWETTTEEHPETYIFKTSKLFDFEPLNIFDESDYSCIFTVFSDEVNYFEQLGIASTLKTEGYNQEDISIDNVSSTKFFHPEFPEQARYFFKKEKGGEELYFRLFFDVYRAGTHDPIIVKDHECNKIFNQILSTFKFIKVTAEGLPEEIKNNKDFIDWIKDWQVVKPTYTVDKFTKINEALFSLNGKTINTDELEHAMEGIESPYFPEERREHVKIYSPDRTKFIFNAGYPDPLEVDQDVVLFNLSTEKYQFLKTCGTACWFEKVFWINNNQFVVIRTGEYSFTEEYEHSIFLYDLEKNIVMEYKSSEKISTEELKKK